SFICLDQLPALLGRIVVCAAKLREFRTHLSHCFLPGVPFSTFKERAKTKFPAMAGQFQSGFLTRYGAVPFCALCAQTIFRPKSSQRLFGKCWSEGWSV